MTNAFVANVSKRLLKEKGHYHQQAVHINLLEHARVRVWQPMRRLCLSSPAYRIVCFRLTGAEERCTVWGL